jgi:nucleoside-diphosphate-sugar epimerase
LARWHRLASGLVRPRLDTNRFRSPIVDDEPAQVREWLPYLAEGAGARRPIRLPKWVAQLVAGEMVRVMTDGRPFSNAKAKRELGWELRYPSWRQGFKEEFA